MKKQLAKYNQNNDAEVIISQEADKVVKKVKFGLIRIAGEKEKRRILYKTYQKISAMPRGTNSLVQIPELRLAVNLNQIVLQEESDETVVVGTNFANLPTEIVMLDWDLRIIPNMTRYQLEKSRLPYVIATCHYATENGQKLYYTALEQIKDAVFMRPDEDEDYPSVVAKTYRYGKKLVLI